MYLEGLASCAELTTEHAEEAARESRSMRDLLTWASRIARPGGGAPKLLLAIARLARADWVEGTPLVEITGNETSTTIALFSDHGMGIRERLLPPTKLAVPASEFSRAIRLAPQLIAPFRSIEQPNALVLVPSDAEIDENETISIADSSLHEQERKTAPPKAPSPDAERESNVPSPFGSPKESGIHTHPTVRRMVAVVPEALRSGNDDD